MAEWKQEQKEVWWKNAIPQRVDAAVWNRVDAWEWIVWQRTSSKRLWKRMAEGYEPTKELAMQRADVFLRSEFGERIAPASSSGEERGE